jgi:hypothetical protein
VAGTHHGWQFRFNPQASAADIAGFLESNKLSIVSGPGDKLQNDKVVAFIAVTE